MRKRLVLALVAVSLLFVTSVDAQTDLDRARDKVTTATEALEEYLADLEATQVRGDQLAGQYWQVQSGVAKLDLEIAAAEHVVSGLAEQRAGLQVKVKAIALERYVSRSEDLGLPDHASEADRAAVETLARLVVGSDLSAIDQLALVDAEQQQAIGKLEAQRSEQAEVLAEVVATQQQLTDELARLEGLRVALSGELVVLENSLAELQLVEEQRQAEAAEQQRLAQARVRAEAAAAAAARQVAAPEPAPQPVAPTVTATPVPDPQPVEPFPTVTATPVPNPQPVEPFPTVTATPVPNPQPVEPFPTAAATPVPNPQPSTPVVPTNGGIVCPLAGAFTHTDDFNSPRAVGGIHRANDLISAQGTPVLAAATGSIEHRDSSVGGMSAHLKGDNGDYYFYTHLSGYENVGAGSVSAGTVIGYVGMTGNAPIPHLHFEIHRGGYGNYANPYGPVRTACFG